MLGNNTTNFSVSQPLNQTMTNGGTQSVNENFNFPINVGVPSYSSQSAGSTGSESPSMYTTPSETPSMYTPSETPTYTFNPSATLAGPNAIMTAPTPEYPQQEYPQQMRFEPMPVQYPSPIKYQSSQEYSPPPINCGNMLNMMSYCSGQMAGLAAQQCQQPVQQQQQQQQSNSNSMLPMMLILLLLIEQKSCNSPTPTPAPAAPAPVAPSATGTVQGDPHFVGISNGDTFSIQPTPGSYINLLEDQGVRINAQVGAWGTATVMTNMGLSLGNTQIQMGSTGAPTIVGNNGQTTAIASNTPMTLSNGDTVTWNAGNMTLSFTTPEYSGSVNQESSGGNSWLNLNLTTGAQGVLADGVSPEGLLGRTAVNDVGTVDPTTGAGDLDPGTTLQDYETTGLFAPPNDSALTRF